MSKSRATELAEQMERALNAEPPGTGTRIEIRDGDYEIIVAGLQGRLDEARCAACEEQLECLRIVVSALAGKLNLPSEELIEMLNRALDGVRAGNGLTVQ